MVGLYFLLWALIRYVSAFSRVEAGTFCLAPIHFSLAGLLGLGVGLLFHWCLTLACALRRRGLSICVLLFWLVGFAAGALASILVSTSSVYSGIIAFSYSDHLVPYVFWSELWFHILA